jgi:hypothetical protein
VLLDPRLRAPLPRLPIIPLLHKPRLRLPIARQPRHRRADGPLHAAADALAEIAQHARGLLPLPARVLLPAVALQALRAEQVAQRLLARADGLVPGAVAALGVVDRDAAGGGRGDGAELVGLVRAGVFVGGVRLEGGVVGLGGGEGLVLMRRGGGGRKGGREGRMWGGSLRGKEGGGGKSKKRTDLVGFTARDGADGGLDGAGGGIDVALKGRHADGRLLFPAWK